MKMSSKINLALTINIIIYFVLGIIYTNTTRFSSTVIAKSQLYGVVRIKIGSDSESLYYFLGYLVNRKFK